MVGKRDTLENRLWAKIDKRSENECWPWCANKNNKGYGMIRLGGKQPKALSHRVVFELEKERIPNGKVIMHSCDNPECCNPNHLFLGTMKDNHADMVAKGRRVIGWNPDNKPPHKFGSTHGFAKLTEEQAREIKFSKAPTKLLCAKFSICRSVIKRIRSGKSWRHL
jgi:hypothetical protein